MSKMMITAAITAMAFTATAADARPNARQRGVASGQEARERAATKDLNAQQLASVGAGAGGGMSQPGMAQQGMQPGMAPTTAAPASAGDAAGMPPQAPDAAGAAAPMSETTPPTDAGQTPQAPTAEPR